MSFTVGPHTFTRCLLGIDPIGASAGINSLSDITNYGLGHHVAAGTLVFYYNHARNILMSVGIDDSDEIISPHRWKPTRRQKGKKFDPTPFILKYKARTVRGKYVPLTTADAHKLVRPV